jgi:hypothetical protein
MGEANLKRAGVRGVGLVGYKNDGRRWTNARAGRPGIRVTSVAESLVQAFRSLGRMALGKASTAAVDRRKTSVRTP